MKSERQLRAEALAARFVASGRKPVVLEFAGVPKAGKTTTLGQLQTFLKRCGFRVETVVERASICPIRDKKHANFNVWTACTTLAQILEKTQTPPRPDDPDILILDRGLFDSLCWLKMMERLSRLRAEDLSVMERFLRLDDWRKRISAVFVMTAEPQDAMDREKGDLPVEESTGSIMNADVLAQSLATTLEMATELEQDFRIYIVNTSEVEFRDAKPRVVERVADLALDVIEEQLKEEILSAPKHQILAALDSKTWVSALESRAITDVFGKLGTYQPRDVVESNSGVIQALPVVIVRNKSGDVLRLRRKEASKQNPLHEKLVIWAGGHVRVEDGVNGRAMLRCAARELQEELRLSVEESELTLCGCVYVPEGERTSKHLAIVYEWRADTDDVAVALSNAEFFERRGNSLSGRFVSVQSLVEEATKSTAEVDVWSLEILRKHLAPDSKLLAPKLF